MALPECAGAPPVEALCRVCGSEAHAPLYVKNGYPLHRCRTCEATYCARPPLGEALTALFSAAYFLDGGMGYSDYIGDERAHRKQARRYLREIAALGIATGTLLDVGCAAGFFLDEARRSGWTVTGCDVSEYAQRYATTRLGLDVARAAFLDEQFAPTPHSFDVCTLHNVLEHLSDPMAVAQKLFRLVRPGGFVLLETWDPRSWFARLLGSAWPTYAPPTVLQCFTPKTLTHVFRPDRWTLLSYRTATKWISLGHGLSLLEHGAPTVWVANIFAALRRSRVGQISVPYRLGDLTTAVLRRSESTS